VAYESNDKKMDSVYGRRIKAGKRRTYFFDVRSTRGNDYFLTITESRKRFNDDGYDRHKIFLYKEDFNKFLRALNEAVDYVKTELMPDFDFDAFNHDNPANGEEQRENGYSVVSEPESENGAENTIVSETSDPTPPPVPESEPAPEKEVNGSIEEVDKW
jgi:hypothetical protein